MPHPRPKFYKITSKCYSNILYELPKKVQNMVYNMIKELTSMGGIFVMQYMEYILSIVLAVLGSTGLWTFIQHKLDEKSASRKALLGITYYQIVTACETYLQRGYITLQEYEDLHQYLFLPYQEMGGNGTAKALLEKVKQLPNKHDEE